MDNQQTEVSLGIGGTLKNIIIKPTVAFHALDVKLAITLFVILVILAYLFSSIVAMTIPMDESLLIDIPPEQAEIAKNVMGMMRSPGGIVISIVVGSIATVVGALIKAGVLALFFMALGAKTNYTKIIAILSLAWVPLFLREVLRSMLILLTGTSLMETISPLANNLDVFVLWNVVLLIIGFAIIYKISYVKSAIPVVGYWVLTILYSLGIGSISGMFTP